MNTSHQKNTIGRDAGRYAFHWKRLPAKVVFWLVATSMMWGTATSIMQRPEGSAFLSGSFLTSLLINTGIWFGGNYGLLWSCAQFGEFGSETPGLEVRTDG